MKNLIGLAMLFALGFIGLAMAQTPTSFDPSSAKVDQEVTLHGAQLGTSHVEAIYLSAEKGGDYKTTIVKQGDDAIVFIVPKVTPGMYSVSLLPVAGQNLLWYEGVKLQVVP